MDPDNTTNKPAGMPMSNPDPVTTKSTVPTSTVADDTGVTTPPEPTLGPDMPVAGGVSPVPAEDVATVSPTPQPVAGSAAAASSMPGVEELPTVVKEPSLTEPATGSGVMPSDDEDQPGGSSVAGGPGAVR